MLKDDTIQKQGEHLFYVTNVILNESKLYNFIR